MAGSMIELINRYHKDQYRNTREVPYTEHLIGVAAILSKSLSMTEECKDFKLRRDIIDAALGHDLLEDTAVSDEEIIDVSSERTLKLIRELSNSSDDYHIDDYMDQLESDSEEAGIIN